MRLAIAGLRLRRYGGHVVVKNNSVAVRFEIFFYCINHQHGKLRIVLEHFLCQKHSFILEETFWWLT